MSRSRDVQRARVRQAWRGGLTARYEAVRDRVRPEPHWDIPEDVLVSEAAHFFPHYAMPETGFAAPGLEAPTQYMALRLMGLADTQAEREKLAERLLRDVRGGGRPIGVSPVQAGRRSETAGRRRRERRRGQSSR